MSVEVPVEAWQVDDNLPGPAVGNKDQAEFLDLVDHAYDEEVAEHPMVVQLPEEEVIAPEYFD